MSDNNLTFQIELTDTFGGEANYSWVTRKKGTIIGLPHTNRRILKEARKRLELGSIKLRLYYNLGDELSYSLDGACVRLFIHSFCAD